MKEEALRLVVYKGMGAEINIEKLDHSDAVRAFRALMEIIVSDEELLDAWCDAISYGEEQYAKPM